MCASEVKMIVRGPSEQLYTNKLDNIEEMNKFPETYNLPKWKEEEIECLERPSNNVCRHYNKCRN